jgi:hypothetical protein
MVSLILVLRRFVYTDLLFLLLVYTASQLIFLSMKHRGIQYSKFLYLAVRFTKVFFNRYTQLNHVVYYYMQCQGCHRSRSSTYSARLCKYGAKLLNARVDSSVINMVSSIPF